ncbi:MAG: FHA domain-containing protein, partial [Crocosphaera sp.]
MNTNLKTPEKNRHLMVIEDQKYRQTISLQEETYSIGRHHNNSIIINSQQASRRHGTLMRRKNRNNNNYSYWIIDGDMNGNKSRNGIYVNGEKCLVKE